MGVKGAIATVATLMVVMGSAFGSVWFLDARYAPMAAFDDFVYSQLKADIRDLHDRIALRPGDRGLQEDLDQLLDRLCRSYPDDRECSE